MTARVFKTVADRFSKKQISERSHCFSHQHSNSQCSDPSAHTTRQFRSCLPKINQFSSCISMHEGVSTETLVLKHWDCATALHVKCIHSVSFGSTPNHLAPFPYIPSSPNLLIGGGIMFVVYEEMSSLLKRNGL